MFSCVWKLFVDLGVCYSVSRLNICHLNNTFFVGKKHNIIKSVNEENTGYLKLEEGTKVTVINRNGYGEVWVVSGGKGGWIPETHIENDNSNKGKQTM